MPLRKSDQPSPPEDQEKEFIPPAGAIPVSSGVLACGCGITVYQKPGGFSLQVAQAPTCSLSHEISGSTLSGEPTIASRPMSSQTGSQEDDGASSSASSSKDE